MLVAFDKVTLIFYSDRPTVFYELKKGRYRVAYSVTSNVMCQHCGEPTREEVCCKGPRYITEKDMLQEISSKIQKAQETCPEGEKCWSCNFNISPGGPVASDVNAKQKIRDLFESMFKGHDLKIPEGLFGNLEITPPKITNFTL